MADAASGLYQEIILDHSRAPRNFRVLEPADRTAEGHNPLCGDQITLYVRMEGDRIAELTFQGHGCAISKASASLMTTIVKGRDNADAEHLIEEFHRVVTGKLAPDVDSLGKLAAFGGVSKYPARVKCASLAWHTLRAALEDRPTPVSTE